MNVKQTLDYLTELFLSYLDELITLPLNDFIHGEISAYVECLEIISRCDHADAKLTQSLLKKYGTILNKLKSGQD